MYATITSFLEGFDAREIAALQKSAIDYPYNGAFNNNDTQYPQLSTYSAYGGLPLGLWPDYSENPLELKKLQPNVGDNLTKVWGKHVVKIGIFSQRTTNNQTATNPTTNGVDPGLLLWRGGKLLCGLQRDVSGWVAGVRQSALQQRQRAGELL